MAQLGLFLKKKKYLFGAEEQWANVLLTHARTLHAIFFVCVQAHYKNNNYNSALKRLRHQIPWSIIDFHRFKEMPP